MSSEVRPDSHLNIQILVPDHAVKDALLILQCYSCWTYRIDQCCAANSEVMACGALSNSRRETHVSIYAKCSAVLMSTLVEELWSYFGDSAVIGTSTSA
jgi:hypothetical protein